MVLFEPNMMFMAVALKLPFSSIFKIKIKNKIDARLIHGSFYQLKVFLLPIENQI